MEEINNEVISFSNNLQEEIQSDLVTGHLVGVTNVSADGYSATLAFDNPSSYETTIAINPSSGVISYGRSGNVIDYEIPGIADLMLSPDSKIEYIPGVNEYLKIYYCFKLILILQMKHILFMINSPVNYVY